MATVIAILRDHDTGDAAVHFSTYSYEAEACEFWWTEGNMGCDCNKRLIIRRANCLPEVREQGNCGHRIRLEALYYDGERLV